MRIGKRLAALVMALVLCCGCLAAPAAAVESRGLDNAAHIVSDFWDLMARTVNPIYAIIAGYLEESKTPETATEEDWKNAYTQYNVNVQNNYNTTVIGSNGYLLYATAWDDFNFKYNVSVSSYSNTSVSESIVFIPGSGTNYVQMIFSFVAPASGYYTGVAFESLDNCFVKSYFGRTPGSRFLMNEGSKISQVGFELVGSSPDLFASAVLSYGFLFEPPNYNVNDFTQDIGGADSRVGTFSGNFGYYGDNGEMIFAENISIVNETNNTYYNPVTGDTSTINEWTYDYSDRSYNVTLDTGDTVNVVYGDENIVIRQGDTVYNIYYTVPSTPEPTPPPSPTPLPTPTPSSSLPPTASPGPTDPVEPGEKPDTSGWGILDFLKGIFDFLWGIVKAIADAITNVLTALLMPKEESIAKIQKQVDEKLPFISDLKDFADDFHGALVNPIAMVRSSRFTSVIDVGKKKSGVSYGDAQADVLDVSWYLEYKDTVDDIIEGLAWLVFLWNLYGALPSIIHGGASGLHITGQIINRKDEHDT